MGFSRQEYWSGLPSPPPGHLPHLVIEPVSLTSPALAGECFAISATFVMTYFNLSFPVDSELHEDRIHAALRAAQEPG